ncbi:MAG: hypothetical protein GF399_05610 [Candidatus Coatesbacteria bacterium]|nr:hypothetical protein [Candidatus Coatesbacteria bacterium]
MPDDNPTTRRPLAWPLAALSATLFSLLAALNYFMYIFFELYLEPWFWPALALSLTAIAFIELAARARRLAIERIPNQVLRGLFLRGPVASPFPAVVWTAWAATILIAFRGTVPYLVWPITALAVAVIALVVTLRRRGRGAVKLLSIIAVCVAVVTLVVKLYLDYAADRIDEASHEQLDQLIEEEMGGASTDDLLEQTIEEELGG